jgi:regulatory protein
VAGRPRRRESFAEARQRRAAVDDPAVVLDAAARFLEARPRSVVEVRRRLGGAGYQAQLVDGAIDRMIDLGMLDDEAFARTWIESRDRARPRGERALRQELRVKGIEREVIDAVLAERQEKAHALDEPVDGVRVGPERAAAERLVERNRRSLERVTDLRQRRQRTYALLARSGFDPETCREVAGAFIVGSVVLPADE